MSTSPPTTVTHPRDEFSQDAKECLAKRAGYICTYPDCRRMTIAGSADRKSGLTIVGVAAHITAAAPGGPRYDPLMKREERSSELNGIWMCQTHAKFVDDNPSVCAIDELQRWKRLHEKWVFDRVASGVELSTPGISRIQFRNIGSLKAEYDFRLSKHNIIVGANEAGKTTVAEIIAAFSGGTHWSWFNKRFEFLQSSDSRAYISATSTADQANLAVTLSPQPFSTLRKSTKPSKVRLHTQINGNVAVDWPRSLFRTINLESQLENHPRAPRSAFARALRYLATVFSIDEDTLLNSIREETYANTTLGYRFRQTKRNRIEVLVPGGRNFFLTVGLLSSSELRLAILDVALKLILCSAPSDKWLLIIDSGFFGRLDLTAKKALFEKLTSYTDRYIQTLFCLSIEKDAELLRLAKLDNWVSSARIDRLTLHSFI